MKLNGQMKNILGKSWPDLLVVLIAGLWGYGWLSTEFAFGRESGKNFASFFSEMLLILPPMFVLIGLFEVWVPRAVVERHVGKGSGVGAIAWMVLLAMLQAGPLYAAFPVAISLWRKGCAPRNVFIYLGAFSAMKIPMLTFEVAFLGWRFSLARTLITLPVFILLGYLMERLLPPDFSPPTIVSGR